MKTNNASILNFDEELNDVSSHLAKGALQKTTLEDSIEKTSHELDLLLEDVRQLTGQRLSIDNEEDLLTEESASLQQLNETIDSTQINNAFKNHWITTQDVLVSALAGVTAAVIDIFLVGSPEVVKLWKSGENFDGSVLTGLLRKLGKDDNGFLHSVAEWCCNKCSVPYDISLKKDVVLPDNHRLRNPGHDPFFGLLFAIADILMGTTTCVDNNGAIRIIFNTKNIPLSEKLLSPLFYLGHLLSDVFTARGLPIPGFFLTQFFTTGKPDKSIAKIAERMYKDGYDLRHLASMSTPVLVKDLIIRAYLSLSNSNASPLLAGMPLSLKEKIEIDAVARSYKMRLISDVIADIGNVAKFAIPFTANNWTALNICEWYTTIKDGIVVAKIELADRTAKKVLINREIIEKNWEQLEL